jgi:hypothetical protein
MLLQKPVRLQQSKILGVIPLSENGAQWLLFRHRSAGSRDNHQPENVIMSQGSWAGPHVASNFLTNQNIGLAAAWILAFAFWWPGLTVGFSQATKAAPLIVTSEHSSEFAVIIHSENEVIG